jgi:hypothetical protein
MKPGPGQIGCAYTGSAGGPMRTEMKSCANDAVERVITTTANTSQRTAVRLIDIFCFPLVATGLSESPRLQAHYAPKKSA